MSEPILSPSGWNRQVWSGRRLQLLYSAVCGTGLDVIPLPGNVRVESLGRLIGDVAMLAVRLGKPLAARLLPAPGRQAGEMARYGDERLVECRVFDVQTGDASCH